MIAIASSGIEAISLDGRAGASTFSDAGAKGGASAAGGASDLRARGSIWMQVTNRETSVSAMARARSDSSSSVTRTMLAARVLRAVRTMCRPRSSACSRASDAPRGTDGNRAAQKRLHASESASTRSPSVSWSRAAGLHPPVGRAERSQHARSPAARASISDSDPALPVSAINRIRLSSS